MFKFKNNTKSVTTVEESHSSSDAASLRAKIEKERMSRRQALRKMGVTAGLVLVALPTVDELARLAAKQLAASSGNSELANSLAKGLRNAGVAFADPSSTRDPNDSGWRVEDCKSRCRNSIDAHLEQDVTDQHAKQNAAAYCDGRYPDNLVQQHMCYIEQLRLLVEPNNKFKADHTYQYLNCCYGLCDDRAEGTEECLSVLRPPREGTDLA